jgi:phosphoenolpyruvate synthase/pyruvate phosphate dikinase
MFFAEDRIPHMQAMILAREEKARRKALAKLLPMQRKDFAGLFQAMDGFPVVIRTLDPPLHEFLPKREDLMVDLDEEGDVGEVSHPAGTIEKTIAGIVEARGGAARVQSDAGASRVPVGDQLSGDHGDAGAGDFRSGCAGCKAW